MPLPRTNSLLATAHRAFRPSLLARSVQPQLRRTLFSAAPKRRSSPTAVIVTAGFLIWLLYPTDDFARLGHNKDGSVVKGPRHDGAAEHNADGSSEEDNGESSAWSHFASQFESMSIITDKEWAGFSDKLVGYIFPEWSKTVPGFMRKLQRELSMSPGSLAEELWDEAHDPTVNPEIRYTAKVRVSSELCDDEKEFLDRRKKKTTAALAKYLGLKESDVNPEDVPTIAMCGSGGGLRALIAGTGSLLATEEDGLFDCVTYTAGVSGSCWLQTLYLTSFNKGSIKSLLEHLKSRTGTHIAYPPVAFQSLTSSPTNKYLLSGVVEKLRGDKDADFGLVDIYGLLLGARFLVPKGELGVNGNDFKISNQRELIKDGSRPLPIYTAVRHEIPGLKELKKKENQKDFEAAKEKATKESWFQWYEMTPYEVFCEEIGAGIPTWAFGRKFKDGQDVPLEHGLHLPEIRTPLLMGIFGSAFCATLSHYYKEVQPIVKNIAALKSMDELISGKDDELSKIHPIDPAIIPNFAYQMYGKLAKTATPSIYEDDHIQLMDAGMSNNLPIYPLLRPGRDVDVLITFDASADVKTDNWLSVADGYAKQRGIKGWPIGVGWPKEDASVQQIKKDLEDAEASTPRDADKKLEQAKASQSGDLGPCTVWVGTTEERVTKEAHPPTTPVSESDDWRLMHPNAGLALVYLPFLPNKKVPGVSPAESEFMSTWNFVYTPEQIDSVVELARANYDEGKEQIRSTIRAIFERKKQMRLKAEGKLQSETTRANTNANLLKEGDQFS
ncbi:hypothetical protein VHEMI00516 [[Torrubiella] hemipterigena]|uniref:Lysophospholipase n=1 Tax=[Torrubiella] hemipterigena TaxID=1531966 RepID=A0A0A1SQM3_9HYPO|nr:hypothetical protein VHEMI00516 [[Torrubiella] hemipterigena]